MTDADNTAVTPSRADNADDDVKALAGRLLQALDEKVRERQGGVPTFNDNFLNRKLRQLLRNGTVEAAALASIEALAGRMEAGRMQPYRERASQGGGGADLRLSQGAWDVMHWRGLPLFKTVFEFALYPMLLWEVKPRTLIEIGAGSGASALWLADLMQAFGIDGRVVSLDLEKPEATHERVRFIAGDCERIAEAFPDMELAGMAHPWVVIEDAHVNVIGVLRHLHPHLKAGDYLVVEDSAIKGGDLARFDAEFPGCYQVDSLFTDYFGRNATACPDSILRRT